MKKLTAATLALLIGLASAGCWGPQKLTRHLDDWTNQGYADDPWLLGNTVSALALRGFFAMAGILDAFINAYYFWAFDAWPLGEHAGTGTRFEHRPVTPTKTKE